MALGLALGAPDIYRVPDEVRRTLGAVRMDVCAFVGVAPRGPVREPVEPEYCTEPRAFVESTRARRRSVAVAVDSWDQYLALYGGFEGPGRLPYAVASFFEQGGRRAYIVRIVHNYADPASRDLGNTADDLAAVASAELNTVSASVPQVTLQAKSEGSWGNQLRAALGFALTPLDFYPTDSSTTQLRVADGQGLTSGTLLRLSNSDPDHPADHYVDYRFVAQCWREGDALSAETLSFVTFSTGPLPAVPDRVDIISGDCLIVDTATGVEERFDKLGLSATHPNWLATVLYRDSQLVNPTEHWLHEELLPNTLDIDGRDARQQYHAAPARFSGGEDRYDDIVHEDFFDAFWVAGDEQPGNGIHALTRLTDLSLLVTPDLYVPEALPEADSDDEVDLLSGAEFAPCVELAAQPVQTETQTPTLPGLVLDPTLPEDLKTIIRLQKQVADLAAEQQAFVALLDMPPGLHQRQQLSWRSQFNSRYVAAYHPWLNITNLDDSRDTLVLLNPSAVAAGIIAHQENLFGVFHGPANVVAKAVVSVDEWVSDARHDQLHPLGINVFKQQRDGVWLSAGRTLSRDPLWRQLSVLRLMVMLRRVLYRQMQWVVFENNTQNLRADLRFKLVSFLRQLYTAGAFKGASEAEAFFVRCDSELNHQAIVDAGKLLVEIGVAPVEPMEFIVVRISRNADGTLTVEG